MNPKKSCSKKENNRGCSPENIDWLLETPGLEAGAQESDKKPSLHCFRNTLGLCFAYVRKVASDHGPQVTPRVRDRPSIVGHRAVLTRHAARRAAPCGRACPCYGPGLRPTARHMDCFSVPCRPLATANCAVPCQPTVRQLKKVFTFILTQQRTEL